MREFTWSEDRTDTLRIIVENYLETARFLLPEVPVDQVMALSVSIADAAGILSDLGDPCDCCRRGTYSHPDQMGDCLSCKHIPERHEDYSGPAGSTWEHTS